MADSAADLRRCVMMTSSLLKFTIPLNPATKKNSQQIVYNPKTRRPFITQSKKYKQYEKDAKNHIKGRGLRIDGPVEVTAVFYRATKHNVDLTNLMEALHDILVKYEVLADDGWKIIRSVDGSRIEFDKENPRTEVTIRRL